MFDQTHMKQLIQAAEKAWYTCPLQTCLISGFPNEQNIAHQTRELKKCFKLLIECLMAFKFYQTRPNTIKHIQTRSKSTKQGDQTVKCLVTKQFLMVYGRQTFFVCPGPYSYIHATYGLSQLKTLFLGLRSEKK